MSHMVIFRAGDGKPGYHQTDGLEESVRFVERLRNTENVEQARIFQMDEVAFNFKPYYRVELGDEASDAPERERAEPPASPAALVAVPEPEPDDDEVVDSEISMAAFTDDEVVGANGRRGLFGR